MYEALRKTYRYVCQVIQARVVKTNLAHLLLTFH